MKNTRLERRQAQFKASGDATKRPGSQNAHKSFPLGNGHRSKSKIKADSRAATN